MICERPSGTLPLPASSYRWTVRLKIAPTASDWKMPMHLRLSAPMHWGDDGLPKFTDVILNNADGMTISNVSYALKIHFGSRYCYPDTIGHPGTASNEEALRIRTMWKDDTNEQSYLRLPPISLTTEESEERADIMIQVDTYAQEMMLKFITGAESLDYYDTYLQELDARGMQRAIEITQNALDRYLAQ